VIRALGKAFSPAVFNGIVIKLNPIRRKIVRIIKNIKGVVSYNSVTTHIEGTIKSKPVINNGFAPKRLYILPVTGDIKALTSAPGSNKRPASKELNPLPSCKYIGNKIISAYMIIVIRMLIIEVNVIEEIKRVGE
jgi:hypothetical protein